MKQSFFSYFTTYVPTDTGKREKIVALRCYLEYWKTVMTCYKTFLIKHILVYAI